MRIWAIRDSRIFVKNLRRHLRQTSTWFGPALDQEEGSWPSKVSSGRNIPITVSSWKQMATDPLRWALRSKVSLRSWSLVGPQVHENDQITVVSKISFFPCARLESYDLLLLNVKALILEWLSFSHLEWATEGCCVKDCPEVHLEGDANIKCHRLTAEIRYSTMDGCYQSLGSLLASHFILGDTEGVSFDNYFLLSMLCHCIQELWV